MASIPINLPTPDTQALLRSQQLAQIIQLAIKKEGGWISFAQFMHMALYTPSLGYYSGGAQKFGQAGDFVTAPEITPLFAQTIALQAAQILVATQGENLNTNASILELGAGTGKLAADLLLALNALNRLPSQYFILEVSDHLRQVQRETCAQQLPAALLEKMVWLDTLPEKFNGLIFGNEVLDALPVHLVHKTPQGWLEQGVAFDGDFIWQAGALSMPNLADNLAQHLPHDLTLDLPLGYLTEACPAAPALVNSLAEVLETGAILLIDYGFNAREYYHPQRNQGTLMCHYQHFAHSNPLIYVGLQDITAHVNFSQIAANIDLPCSPMAHATLSQTHQASLIHLVSMRVAGHCSQAQFLINCGILSIMQQFSPTDSAYIKLASAAQKLLSPAEMGDLFKVIAFTKNIDEPLIGFVQGDKTHTL